MTHAKLCGICELPVHRYSPDHPEHGPQGRADLMGCVNSLLAELDAVRFDRDALVRKLAAHRRAKCRVDR